MLSTFILEQQIKILQWFLKDCDTEDWSNDAESSALPSQEYDANDIKITFKMYTKIK